MSRAAWMYIRPAKWGRQHLLEHLDGERTKLCLAFFVDDGAVQPLPPVRRAMSIVIDRLKQAGHSSQFISGSVETDDLLTFCHRMAP